MSEDLATNRLPDRIEELFDGEHLEESFGLAYELVTTDEDGWPRIAMLSHGEILVTDASSIRVALWANTNTAKNLAAGRPFMLSIVDEGMVCYAAGTASTLSSDDNLDLFELGIERLRVDQHKGLPVTGPITFRSEEDDIGPVLSIWHRQVDMMRHATPD